MQSEQVRDNISKEQCTSNEDPSISRSISCCIFSIHAPDPSRVTLPIRILDKCAVSSSDTAKRNMCRMPIIPVLPCLFKYIFSDNVTQAAQEVEEQQRVEHLLVWGFLFQFFYLLLKFYIHLLNCFIQFFGNRILS